MLTATLKEAVLLKAFVILALGSAAAGFVAGALAGMLIGLYHAATGGTMADIQFGAAVAGGIAGFIVSYFVFRLVIRRFVLPRVMLDPPTPIASAV